MMFLDRIVIRNFKCFRDFEMEFRHPLTVAVGDNETGKSTLLEAISLCLTQQLSGRHVLYELSPYLLNKDSVQEYVCSLKQGKPVPPPAILIEIYFKDSLHFAELKGTNNVRRMNVPGVKIQIEYDENYQNEYESYIADPSKVMSVPVEYYTVRWFSFANNPITKRGLDVNVSFIDTTTIRFQYGSDQYIQRIIDDSLDAKERAELSLAYRLLKERFAEDDALSRINTRLSEQRSRITDKRLQVSIDVSHHTGWEANLTSYLDEIPFQYVGKGDQSMLKMLMALDRTVDQSHLILIEEPENHLSYANMNHLIGKIEEKCQDKQVVLTTHSAFVLNKLGVDRVAILGGPAASFTLDDLEADTREYFRKLPGYDTLRLIISKKAILVEGPSDELVLQKAYLQVKGRLPIEDRTDVISVGGLAFKRFLEIGRRLSKRISLVTDNDGDYETNVEQRYKDFFPMKNIRFCYSKDNKLKTLERHIVNINELDVLNAVLQREASTKEKLCEYMIANKTECALKLLDSSMKIVIPQYILDAFSD